MKISELTTKVNSYEVTDPTKQVSAEEYNTILKTVQEHDVTLPETVAKVEELEGKAITTENIEDSIKDLSVKDLTGVIEATPEEFNFRPSAGDKSIRDESAVIRRIKGNSLVWNQQIKTALDQENIGANGWWCRTGSDKITLDGRKISYNIVPSDGSNNQISQKVSIKKEHKYLIHFWYDTHGVINDDYGRAFRCLLSNDVYGNVCQVFVGAQNGITSDIINLLVTSDSNYEYLILKETYVTNNIVDHVMDFSDIQLIDLTQMFGAGNEPTTIEEFYASMPLNVDMYAYNEGEIIDMNVNGIKTVGFNQWDEEWEIGGISLTSGEEFKEDNRIRSINYNKAFHNAEYYVRTSDKILVFWYDANKEFIKYSYCSESNKVISPNNASFFKICLYDTYGTTYKHDICINFSHSGVRNGEYEPYKENYRALPDIKKYFPDGMKSVGSVFDEINSQYAIQRVGAVDLGSLKFSKGEKTFLLQGIENLKNPAGWSIKSNIVCALYTTESQEVVYNATADKSIASFTTGVGIVDSSFTDAAAFKNALQGVMLYYELAEPIITPLDEPIQLDYVVEDWGTEEAISDEPSASFCADIVYRFNAEGRIRDNSRNIEILENMVRLLQAKIQHLEALLTTEVENTDESETIIE